MIHDKYLLITVLHSYKSNLLGSSQNKFQDQKKGHLSGSRLFSSIVDLNHVLTSRSVEKDLSMSLVVQGSAKEISMAFL